MLLKTLNVSQVRNLESISLDCDPVANIIYGANGSGKTSILESIFLLGRGRSFKHRDLRLVINSRSEQLVVSAKTYKSLSDTTHQLGIKRTAKGDFEARFDGRSIKSAAELAAELPLQLIDAQSFSLIAGGPLQRRQFIDWGVFHVEHHLIDQSSPRLWTLPQSIQ